MSTDREIDPARVRGIKLHPSRYQQLRELIPVSNEDASPLARLLGLAISEHALVPPEFMMVELDDGSYVPVRLAKEKE